MFGGWARQLVVVRPIDPGLVLLLFAGSFHPRDAGLRPLPQTCMQDLHDDRRSFLRNPSDKLHPALAPFPGNSHRGDPSRFLTRNKHPPSQIFSFLFPHFVASTLPTGRCAG